MKNVLLALFAGILAAIAMSCGGGGAPSTPPGTLPPANSVLPAAIEAFDSVQTFHFNLTHNNGTTPIPNGLQLVSADGDVIVPDRMQANIEARASGQTVRVEVIGIGNEGWMTNPFNRQWQPLPSGTTIKDIFDPAQGVKAIVGSLQNAQVVGQEKVGGAQTWHIKGDVQSDVLTAAVPVAKPGFTVGIEAWVGVSDSLIRQVYLEGPIMPGEADNIVRRLTLSDFGEPLTINPPL